MYKKKSSTFLTVSRNTMKVSMNPALPVTPLFLFLNLYITGFNYFVWLAYSQTLDAAGSVTRR